MNWKRSITGIVSIALLGAGVKLVIACSDGPDPTDTYVSFFQNNVTAQPQYKPFYYTDYGRLGPIYSYNYGQYQEDDGVPSGNTAEWYAYCNKEVKSNDIDSFMNKFTYSQVKAYATKKTGTAEVKNNTFCKYLVQPRNKEALDYILYAKKCETICVPAEGYWDEKAGEYVNTVRDTFPRAELIAEGVAMNGKTKIEFLKWRYAYQALRLTYYNEENANTLKLYDKLIGTKTASSQIYARSLALKAGALYHTRKKKMAAYLYSRAFDMSDDMKRSAYLSFIWATDSIKIPDLFSLCKNNHEKAVLLVMDGLHEREGQEMEGLKLMEKAQAMEPGVKGLNVVMTREINKAEQRYMQERENMERSFTNTYDDLYDADYTTKRKAAWKKSKGKYKTYLNSLNVFAQKITADKTTTDKAFWYLASSYLYFLEDKFADSKKQLDLAGAEKMNPHEKDVHSIISMLCTVYQSDKITPAIEAELLPSLKEVEKRQQKSMRFAKVYKDMLFTILTDRYMAQKDTVKAIYCLGRIEKDEEGDYIVADDYTDVPGALLEGMSTERMKEIESFVQKSGKTEYEEWLTDNTPYTITVLKELEGTKYIRELKFEKAVTVLSSIPRSELYIILPDVLISRIKDSQRWNKSDSASTYNKLEFAKKMVTLQKTLEAQPKNGRAAYQYANALYNMSYYGRAHHAVDYYHGTSDPMAYFTSDARKALPAWKREYYSVIKAQKYYMISFNNTSDIEMKARSLFLAAKCLQKNCDLPYNKTSRYQLDYEDKTYYQNTFTNPYIEQLFNQYRNTKFYHEAYSSCSYLRDFAKRAH